jgi:hypothetical protein
MSKAEWPETTKLIDAAVEILAAQWPMTVRQLFYALFSLSIILENCTAEYKKVMRIIGIAREDGRCPWHYIADRSRPTYQVEVFDNVQLGINNLRENYSRNRWQSQPTVCELWTEKDAIYGSIQDVAIELGIPVRVGRGYQSKTRMHEIAERFRELNKSKPWKPIHVFYLGDFDPSGMNIEEVLRKKIQKYGSGPFEMHRLAIHGADIAKYKLPPQKIKVSDSRAVDFKLKHGKHTVELDALPVNVLRKRIKDSVMRYVDIGLWSREEAVEKVELASIKHVADNWPWKKYSI